MTRASPNLVPIEAPRVRAWRETLRVDAESAEPSPRTAMVRGEVVTVGRARETRRRGHRFEKVVPQSRVALIGEETVVVQWPTRRVLRPRRSFRQLMLHWRVIPVTKGYSLGTDPLTIKEKAESKRLKLHLLPELPKTRGECKDGPRPCYVFRCSMNLWLDVNPESGSIKLNFPDMDPEDLEFTCALDVADYFKDKGTTLEHVGLLMGLTLERIRQIEKDALAEAHAKLEPPGAPIREAEADDERDPVLECPDCSADDPIRIAHVDPPLASVIADPANAGIFWAGRCILAGANRPTPTWSWCQTTGRFFNGSTTEVIIRVKAGQSNG